MSNQASHKAEVLHEIKNLSSRTQLNERFENEKNTTVKIWIWQYIQTLIN